MMNPVSQPKPLYAYVGSYTTPERGGQGNGINVYHVDRRTGAFTVDPRTGHIAPLNRQSTGGYNPVHLAFDATGRFLAVCNYGTDSLAVLPVAADGSLLPYRSLTTVTGTLGPHRIQQRTMC